MQPSQKQMPEQFKSGDIAGVVIRDLRIFHDQRGWLAELFRQDEITSEYFPVMAYISATTPGVTRGPHEHVNQADFFCFIGPSNFKLRMWDRRGDSPTFNHVMTLIVGEDDPKSVLVPSGVVHAYRNIGSRDGIVINCPNRLYMGQGKQDAIDEVRHEGDPETIFRIDD